VGQRVGIHGSPRSAPMVRPRRERCRPHGRLGKQTPGETDAGSFGSSKPTRTVAIRFDTVTEAVVKQRSQP